MIPTRVFSFPLNVANPLTGRVYLFCFSASRRCIGKTAQKFFLPNVLHCVVSVCVCCGGTGHSPMANFTPFIEILFCLITFFFACLLLQTVATKTVHGNCFKPGNIVHNYVTIVQNPPLHLWYFVDSTTKYAAIAWGLRTLTSRSPLPFFMGARWWYVHKHQVSKLILVPQSSWCPRHLPTCLALGPTQFNTDKFARMSQILVIFSLFSMRLCCTSWIQHKELEYFPDTMAVIVQFLTCF